eukprot:11223154-Lingulodinium_polyedra.AAC.1
MPLSLLGGKDNLRIFLEMMVSLPLPWWQVPVASRTALAVVYGCDKQHLMSPTHPLDLTRESSVLPRRQDIFSDDEPLPAAGQGRGRGRAAGGRAAGDDDDECPGEEVSAGHLAALQEVRGNLQEMLGLEGSVEELDDLLPILGVCRENMELHVDEQLQQQQQQSDPRDDEREELAMQLEVVEDRAEPPLPPPEAAAAPAPEVPLAYDPAESLEEFGTRLGLKTGPGWTYTTAEGRVVGYFRFLPNGRSVKANCRLHEKCSNFKNTRGDCDLTCKQLLRWLHAGLADDCTAARHLAIK